MRVIKGLKNTYNILHDLCRGTDESLLILYGWTEPVKPGVAVIHRNRSEDSYDDIKILEYEIETILDEIKNWGMFENIFLHGNFDKSEINIIKKIESKFQVMFNLNITVQVFDKEMEGEILVETTNN